MYAEDEVWEFHNDPNEESRKSQLHAYPRIAFGSPTEERPLTPGGDIVSDELSFAKWRVKGKKQKATHATKKSKLRESLASGADSPASAFVETVNKNTGFSPLNPAAPLHDAFQSTLSPPSQPKMALAAHTPSHSPPPLIRREFLLDPSKTSDSPLVSTKFTMLSPLAETPQESSQRPPFEAVRPQLFQKAFMDSIRGVPFDDTDIYLCSARSKDGIAHKPLAVHARGDFLHAASVVFAEGLSRSLYLSVVCTDLMCRTVRSLYYRCVRGVAPTIK